MELCERLHGILLYLFDHCLIRSGNISGDFIQAIGQNTHVSILLSKRTEKVPLGIRRN